MKYYSDVDVCQSKVGFDSWMLAMGRAIEMRERRVHKINSVYKCEICGLWHLTSKKHSKTIPGKVYIIED